MVLGSSPEAWLGLGVRVRVSVRVGVRVSVRVRVRVRVHLEIVEHAADEGVDPAYRGAVVGSPPLRDLGPHLAVGIVLGSAARGVCDGGHRGVEPPVLRDVGLAHGREQLQVRLREAVGQVRLTEAYREEPRLARLLLVLAQLDARIVHDDAIAQLRDALGLEDEALGVGLDGTAALRAVALDVAPDHRGHVVELQHRQPIAPGLRVVARRQPRTIALRQRHPVRVGVEGAFHPGDGVTRPEAQGSLDLREHGALRGARVVGPAFAPVLTRAHGAALPTAAALLRLAAAPELDGAELHSVVDDRALLEPAVGLADVVDEVVRGQMVGPAARQKGHPRWRADPDLGIGGREKRGPLGERVGVRRVVRPVALAVRGQLVAQIVYEQVQQVSRLLGRPGDRFVERRRAVARKVGGHARVAGACALVDAGPRTSDCLRLFEPAATRFAVAGEACIAAAAAFVPCVEHAGSVVDARRLAGCGRGVDHLEHVVRDVGDALDALTPVVGPRCFCQGQW
eukprot:scaffold10262_cov69-Phaeocystis_antarctica.AAC.2